MDLAPASERARTRVSKRLELGDGELIGLVRNEIIVSCRGADTGPIPAQIAHSANPAQRKINEILKIQGKEKLQTCSIPAPGTTYIIDSLRRSLPLLTNGISAGHLFSSKQPSPSEFLESPDIL
jgi:hypothetical protein